MLPFYTLQAVYFYRGYSNHELFCIDIDNEFRYLNLQIGLGDVENVDNIKLSEILYFSSSFFQKSSFPLFLGEIELQKICGDDLKECLTSKMHIDLDINEAYFLHADGDVVLDVLALSII